MTDDHKPEEHPTSAGARQSQPFTTDALKTMELGQSFTLPILAMPGLPRIFADDVGMAVTLSGFVDLTALTHRHNLMSQDFQIAAKNAQGAEVHTSGYQGAPIIVEEGTVRLTTTTAINLAVSLIKNLKKAVPPAVIEDAMRRLTAD